jgi:RNA polymerase sigma factor (sigma-70 family)
MTDDDASTLLRRYAADRSEGAFRRLVDLHAPWVYAAALRQVRGDRHLAEDVAQAVFVALARRAGTIRSEAALAAWLFRATRYASADAVRRERRRRRQETEAAAMAAQAVPDEDESWRELAPLLDGLIARLGRAERLAIVLRFYQQKPLRDVGLALGVSEEAAKKRVARAVRELRDLCARNGLTAAGALLVAMLEAKVKAAAPAGVSASVASASMAGGGGGKVPALANHVLRRFVMTKVTLSMLPIVLLAGALVILTTQLAAPGNAPAHASRRDRATTTTAPATSNPADAATRRAIGQRLTALQSIAVEYDVEETFSPRLAAGAATAPATPPAAPSGGFSVRLKTGTERSVARLSFLNGAARWETKASAETVAAERAQRVVPIFERIETFADGVNEQLVLRPDGPSGGINPRTRPPHWDALALGLGLRDGWEGPNTLPEPDGGWLTADRLAEMALSRDDAGRPVLSRRNAVGQALEWVFDPAQGHALVAHHRRNGPPPHEVLNETTTADFKLVDGLPLPHTIVSRTLHTEGREVQRWQATVKRYVLADPANAAQRYSMTWPPNLLVVDRRAGVRRQANADGRLPPLPAAPLAAGDPRRAQSDDASTPKGAARLFLEAVGRADAQGAKLLLADDAPAAAPLDALLTEADARLALEQAAVQRFGPGAPAKLPRPALVAFLDRLDDLDVRIAGDRAVLSAPRQPDPALHLVRTADGWRVRQLPGDPAALARSALAMADVANRLAAEIRNGKFGTMADAAAQIHPRYAARINKK